MVIVAEGEEIAPVPTDQSEARDGVELAQVKREVEDLVLKGIGEWAGPAVSDDTLEEMRPHAARSCTAGASRSATAKPDRQPSSWKP